MDGSRWKGGNERKPLLCTSNGRGSAGYAANQSALLAWVVSGLIVISILGRRSLLVPMCQWRFPFSAFRFSLFAFRFSICFTMRLWVSMERKRAGCVGASRMLSHATAQRIWESHDAHAALLSPTTQQTLCKKFSSAFHTTMTTVLTFARCTVFSAFSMPR
jgi:hypothetical protein